MRPDAFHIQIEKSVYFPGEIVRGSLTIQNRQDLKCKGIRVTLQGKGHSHFTTGSGDNKEVRTHTQMYASSKKTVWGNVMKTPVLNDAGAHAIFGPPWCPDEGVLYLSVTEQQFSIVVRVMDYDWCKKDDLLGEICLDIRNYIERGDLIYNLQLNRNGKPETGVLAFSMQWEHVHTILDPHNPNARTIRLQIHSATNLRSADWFGGRNDVYVQAYALPSSADVNPHKPLPLPNEALVLPPCNMQMPFQFQLPNDLPSSFVLNGLNFIAYSIYANIDITWKLDVTHRIFFTVIQPNAAAAMMYPLYKYLENDIYPQGCIPPCCCINIPLDCFASYGLMRINAYLERTAYAPGEVMLLVVKVESSWGEASKNLSVSAQVMRHTTLFAEGHYHHCSDGVSQAMVIRSVNEPIPFPMPSAAPTYLGGLGQDLNWYGQVSRYGGRWASARPDPVVWRYSLRINFALQVPGCAMNPMEMTVDLPVVMSGMGLNVLPAIHYRNGQMPPQQQMMMGAPQQQPHQPSGAEMVQQLQTPQQPQQPQLQQQPPQYMMQQQQLPMQGYPQMQQQQAMPYQQQYQPQQMQQSQQQYPQNTVVASGSYPGAIGGPQAYPQQMLVPSLQQQQQQQQSAYPTASQQMVRTSAVSPEPSSYMQSIVFPTEQSSDSQSIPDWKTYPEIRDSLSKLSHCPLVPNSGQPVLIRDHQEDHDVTDHSTLTYQPMYYASPPTMIRD